MPLNLTDVAPKKPFPFIVTIVPGPPLVGVNDEIVGAPFTVIVIAFDVEGFGVAQVRLDVITQVTISPFANVFVVYTLLFVPTFVTPLFH